jgi:hypothetical protein
MLDDDEGTKLVKRTNSAASCSLTVEEFNELWNGNGYYDVLEVRANNKSNKLIKRFTRTEYQRQFKRKPPQLLEVNDDPGATAYYVMNLF